CTKNQLWQFDNMLKQGQAYNEYDKLYVPRVAHVTGNVELHDVVEDKNGRIVFVNTLYSCLATVSDKYSFEPLWRPNFITKLVPEDRCHLNGLAMRNGLPRYVTAISRSDLNSGWRDSRDSGGVVIDIENNEVVGSDLSMPHSPRYYNGKIWVLNAGAGQLGFIDEATGKFESVAFCPGYVRGLSFHGNYAVVAMSKPRHETFSGLALDDALKDKASSAKCGIHIINLESGVTENWLHFEGMISELYDVAVIPNVVRPMALGFKTDEINRMITFQDGEEQYIHMLPEVGNTKPKA
ncbi:MAG: TIGR03032 family protein, partial [Gammaproteobacteria bacterium]|nr:TIGR03032 family protein [Gammaproteobacteria bacterium]